MSNQVRAKRKRRDTVQGITQITVSGFKSLLDQCCIEIRPLTILAGANSTGKSSIMQPLLLLKQTLEATYDPGALLLYGPNIRFTYSEQLLSRIAAKTSTKRFTVGLQTDAKNLLTITFQKQEKRGFELVEMRTEGEVGVTTLRPNMTNEEIVSVIPSEIGGFQKALSEEDTGPLEWMVTRFRCFLAFTLLPTIGGKGIRSGPLVSPTGPFEEAIRKLIHVPGLRGNPERTYKTTAIGARFPGTFENYVASVVNHWQETKDQHLRALGTALENLGLTWKVAARQVDDTQVELRVGRLPRKTSGGAKDVVSIADVGFGLSQTLPVLVALLTAQSGQLVYLEQPEIHLHPRAQVALAQVLAEAAKRGVRVVAETHSSLLILAVQSLVAEGKLSSELVRLHWFKRREDGATEVTSADLDNSGAFGDWPEDFADVELELQSRYLDAVEFRHEKSGDGRKSFKTPRR